MTVHIDPLGAAILAVGCVVAYAVYRHTRHGRPADKGDLVGAVASGVAVITVLVLLLGGGAEATSGDRPAPPVSPSPSRSE
ncbi:hypothetical protein [Streptomyces humi]